MVRYKVHYYDIVEDTYVYKKGWAKGSNFQEAAEAIEKYYGTDTDEVTFKIFENYDDELIEDGYLESLEGEGNEDIV